MELPKVNIRIDLTRSKIHEPFSFTKATVIDLSVNISPILLTSIGYSCELALLYFNKMAAPR